jgi:hypothetical protein
MAVCWGLPMAPRRAPLARPASCCRASRAAALTMIDKKQDKALIERTLKKHRARQGGGVDGGLGGDDGRQLRRAWPR